MITQNERPAAKYILCDILKAMQVKLYHNEARVMFPVSMQWIPIGTKDWYKIL